MEAQVEVNVSSRILQSTEIVIMVVRMFVECGGVVVDITEYSECNHGRQNGQNVRTFAEYGE